APVPWQTRNERAVGHRNGRPLRFPVDELFEKAGRVDRDFLELLASCLRTQVVRRPAALEGGDIARQVVVGRPDQMHGADRYCAVRVRGAAGKNGGPTPCVWKKPATAAVQSGMPARAGNPPWPRASGNDGATNSSPRPPAARNASNQSFCTRGPLYSSF